MMGRDEIVSSGLLEQIKTYVGITWDDEDTDRKTADLIASGMRYLDRKAGSELNYTEDGGDGVTLLREYVRYARDGAMDVFENNYRHLILEMQNERRVQRYAGAQNAVPSGE